MRDGWRAVKLGDACEITKGTSPTLKTPPGRYPLIVTGPEPSSSDTFQFDGAAVCVPLVSSTGHGHASLKRVHYASGRFAVANIIAACVPRTLSGLEARYLFHYLQHFKDDLIVTRMKGTANVSLSIRNLADVPVAVPPLVEQRRIVDLIAAVDDAIEAAEGEVLANQDALVTVLSGILEFNGERSTPVGDLIEYMLGGAWGSAPGTDEVDVRALGPSAYKNGATSVDPGLGTIRSLSVKRASARSLQEGDIVLERSGGSPTQPVGRVIRMEKATPFVVPSDFMRLLRVDRAKADAGFLFWSLWCAYLEGLSLPFQKRTTSIFNLNIPDYLAGLRVKVPSLVEQHEVVELAEAGWASVESSRATAEALRTLRSNLLTVLLSGEHEIPSSYDHLLNLDGEDAKGAAA